MEGRGHGEPDEELAEVNKLAEELYNLCINGLKRGEAISTKLLWQMCWNRAESEVGAYNQGWRDAMHQSNVPQRPEETKNE